MRIMQRSSNMILIMAVIAAALLVSGQRTSAQQEKVLLSFKQHTNVGNFPRASVIFDNAGNLYGTTSEGGSGGAGTVFELSPGTGGGWSKTVLYSFSPKPRYTVNGVSGVALDKAGNLYGTTQLGGTNNLGKVFELMRQAGGGWTEVVLHNFEENGTDGFTPLGGVIMDSAGNLYGTTAYGGSGGCPFNGCGTVYELTPQPNGSWTETILHSFVEGEDGANPYFGLTFDTSGNLYGTTEYGGINAGGTVFEMTPASGGTWTEGVIHSFPTTGTDTGYPEGLTFHNGKLYGATANGGTGDGNVFELTPARGGGWNESILYSFVNGNFGANPDMPGGNLLFDASGNIYGVSQGGSGHTGTVFELAPGQGGTWNETTLYTFDSQGSTGAQPLGGLVFDSMGNLYGVTQYGGAYQAGTVFEIKP